MNSETLSIVSTADGSNTIFNARVGENYHSKNGALQESQHVFVDSGLQFFLERNAVTEVSILEVGFGTGLNFLLSADALAEKEVRLDYTGIEAYPLSKEMIGSTGYDNYCSPALWQSFIDNYSRALTEPAVVNDSCKLFIAEVALHEFASTLQYDVIYFDAFAAAFQPEMWNEAAIAHTLKFLKPGGVFVTYAITGNLKRIVKSLGLTVEKAPGAAGKREMLRAVKAVV